MRKNLQIASIRIALSVLVRVKALTIVSVWRSVMRKIILGLVATVALVTSAQADGRGPRHHGGWGGHQQHHHYRGGGVDPGAAIFGGLVGGLIIGGMINNMNQPRYYQQQYGSSAYYDEPFCQQVVTNRFWNGWRWVYQVQTVCD